MNSGFGLLVDLSAGSRLAVFPEGGNGMPLAMRFVAGQGKGDQALDLLDSMLGEAGLRWSGLRRVAVCAGPGSFTGVRVGIAMCQGLAFGSELPMHAFTSLQAMRLSLPPECGSALLLIAARADRYYASEHPMGTERVLTASQAEEVLRGRDLLLTAGPIPDLSVLAPLANTHLDLDIRYAYASVYQHAIAGPPAPAGILKAHYLLPSAAEAGKGG